MGRVAFAQSFPNNGDFLERPRRQTKAVGRVQKVPWNMACILILKDKKLAAEELLAKEGTPGRGHSLSSVWGGGEDALGLRGAASPTSASLPGGWKPRGQQCPDPCGPGKPAPAPRVLKDSKD